MASPASTPKIEELRFRLKTDPKSRLFYPLAEELRKVGHHTEAEQVLRTGLNYHPSYLSAWVSLGRVSRDQGKSDVAIEALTKALQLDPGNVVAARLLADSYLDAGEKVEAIKKYKLVHALMPSDNDVEAIIEQLDRELTPFVPVLVAEPEPEVVTPSVSEGPGGAGGAPPALPGPSLTLGVTDEPVLVAHGAPPDLPGPSLTLGVTDEPMLVVHDAPLTLAATEPADEQPFADVLPSSAEEAILTGDDEPMLVAHDESPFEEPVADFSAAAVEVEAPQGFQIEEAPPAAAAEPTDTVTMADLYARQGLVLDARRIYEAVLQREPGNDAVRAKLAALAGDGNAKKVARLEEWLSKVARREVSHV